MTEPGARAGVCTVCGYRYPRHLLERHHPIGAAILARVIVLLCLACHDDQSERQRVGGVMLDYDREPSPFDVYWAIACGLSELFAAWGERHGDLAEEAAHDLRRGAYALGRLGAAGVDSRVGPRPSASYRRNEQRDRRRRPVSTRMPEPPASPRFNAAQLRGLLGALALTAKSTLADSKRARYLAQLEAAAGSVDSVFRRLPELSDYPRHAEWRTLLREVGERFRAIVAAVFSVERPREPTRAELAALRAARDDLRELERLAFRFFTGLGGASDAEAAFAVLDELLGR